MLLILQPLDLDQNFYKYIHIHTYIHTYIYIYIYICLPKLNDKKTNNSIKIWQKFKCFTKEHIQKINEHIKRCSASPNIRKWRLKLLGWPKSSLGFFYTLLWKTQTNFLANPSIMVYDYTSIRMSKKHSESTTCWEECRAAETFIHC